jgi:hypothetical protein
LIVYKDLTIASTSGVPITIVATKYEGFKFTHSLTDTFPDYPKTTYRWTQGVRTVVENKRISISQAGNLYIAYVQNSDIGLYTSVVKNTVTSTQYTRPTLTINLRRKYRV